MRAITSSVLRANQIPLRFLTASMAVVTVYADGRIVGCAGSYSGDLAAKVPDLADAAVRDNRFDAPKPDSAIAVSISLLANALQIGVGTPQWVTRPIRFGEQALRVRQGAHNGFFSAASP